MSQDPEPQVARAADRFRDELLVTLRELDRRRQRVMDVQTLVRDNRRVLLAVGAGLLSAGVVAAGAAIALGRSRRGRLAERRVEGLRRAWKHPDRLASRAGDAPWPARIALGLLKVAVLTAGSQLIRRRLQAALPAGR